LRKLGISPDTSASLTFAPQAFSNSSKSSANTTLPLNELKHLSSGDYSVQLPGATAQALLSDSSTQIIQDPQIRILDGQAAKLRIGDRVPVATGSFSAGTGTAVNPLVNTQFQYIDVGVNVDVTPHIHPSGDVSIKVAVEVSSVTGHVTIGSIDQPIISQRKIEHDVRLKEGEVNILGGLFDHTETSSVSGWPGLARVPLLGRVFSSEKVEKQEDEILILLTPHIVRVPEISEKQLRGMYSGTESNVQVRSVEKLGPPQKAESRGSATPATPEVASASAQNTAASQSGQLRFEPQTASLQVGESKKIAVVVDGAADLFSVPMLLQYDPAVLSVEEVRNGGFLSGGTQEIAVVERVDNQRGEAVISATRQPNTQGVGGTGTLIELSIKGVGPGSSKLAIVQVNARDSKQRPIPLVSSEASVQVR
jgi:general secretion pathway protein D